MLFAVALTCATLGTFLDIVLVARRQQHCLGDLGTGEAMAGFVWAASRLVVFPIVAGGSALVSLPINLVACLPWFAKHGLLKAALMACAVLIAAAGPAAMLVHDVTADTTPGECVPPWWPSWITRS
ncbi:hypothetical protein ACFFMN_08565 [Planobispora siamensis]|uniref:Uncharacterized protein n=1 Tax=Planobispora siamensis TaxID=936338 RepID=A0A8J3SAP5_9ACTN|nr:hypothetical protein [Planobispora siamensis]GIH90548.1 hypothetical protein Psi01_11780 [Planobispora siamensis]